MRILITLLLLSFALPAAAQTHGSWERISHRTEFTLWDATCTDSLRCYAVGDYGVIMSSTDGGESWRQKLTANQFALRNIHFFDDSTGIVTGFNGTCFRTQDRGGNWIAVKLPTEVNLPGMSAVGSTVWLSGGDGTILKSTDMGVNWEKLESGTDVMLDAISFADERNGWAGSVQRKLLRTRDGGVTWREQAIDSVLPITTVCARSASECWVAGNHGLIMRTVDDGRSWERVDAYVTDYVTLAFDAKGTGWAVGRRGAIVRGEEGNMRWRLHDLTPAKSLHGIAFLPNNQAIAVGMHGMIFKHHELYPPPEPKQGARQP